MLIKTIAFDIYDFTTHTSESYLIERTTENEEWVFSFKFPRTDTIHKSIRGTEFGKCFDFELGRKLSIPMEMITMDTWIRLINAKPVLFAMVPEIDNYAYIANG